MLLSYIYHWISLKHVVCELNYINFPAVPAVLNSISTLTPTAQPPTTGKCIHFTIITLLCTASLLEWTHDYRLASWFCFLLMSWEPTRLVGTAWKINEPHLSETTVQGRGEKDHFIIQNPCKNYLLPLYYTLVIQLQVRSKLMIHT